MTCLKIIVLIFLKISENAFKHFTNMRANPNDFNFDIILGSLVSYFIRSDSWSGIFKIYLTLGLDHFQDQGAGYSRINGGLKKGFELNRWRLFVGYFRQIRY